VRRNRRQGRRVLDLKASGREKPRSGDVRTQRRCTRRSQDTQDVGFLVGMESGRTALSNAKSGRDVGSTSRLDSRLAFAPLVRQTHRTHRTQGIIFADVISHFRDHIYMFGNLPMYSTEYGDLAYKEQIKDGWRR